MRFGYARFREVVREAGIAAAMKPPRFDGTFVGKRP
jgi:hypothetical protein